MRISSSHKGASSELTVCADLLQRNFLVFRAVSPGTDYDLIADGRGEKPLRVEVRTGRVRNGKLQYDGCHSGDILAVVVGTQITYFPKLPRVRPHLERTSAWRLTKGRGSRMLFPPHGPRKKPSR